MKILITCLLLGLFGCRPSGIELCQEELNEFRNVDFCIKVSKVKFQFRNDIVYGVDTALKSNVYYFAMLRPNPYEYLRVGDFFLKNKNSDYYCLVRNDSCFLGKFECNTYYYNNTLTKYKLDFKYTFGDDFIVDSIGLHLK